MRGGWADPLDAGGGEAGVVAREIIGVKEERDPPAGLIADPRGLPGRGGAGEEEGGGLRARARRAIVISQDGPVSAVWNENKSIYVRKGVTLGNMNMPLGS